MFYCIGVLEGVDSYTYRYYVSGGGSHFDLHKNTVKTADAPKNDGREENNDVSLLNIEEEKCSEYVINSGVCQRLNVNKLTYDQSVHLHSYDTNSSNREGK